MKFSTSILFAILLTLLLPKAYAENPMKQVAKVNPIPMFMPILVKKSQQLELSDQQVAAFTKWRAENMAPAMNESMSIKRGLKAIKQATLNGSSIAEIEELLSGVALARENLAARTLRCHSYVKRTLSAEQWKKMIALYSKA